MTPDHAYQSNAFDVSRERWVTLRHIVVGACFVACVYLMARCSEKWIDKTEIKAEEVK